MKKTTILSAALMCAVHLFAFACTDDDGADNGAEPQGGAITVLTPNGGETWAVGKPHDITWKAEEAITDVTIRLSKDGGATWVTVISPTFDVSNASWPTFSWTPAEGDTCTACRVRIEEYNGTEVDVSDGDFAIE